MFTRVQLQPPVDDEEAGERISFILLPLNPKSNSIVGPRGHPKSGEFRFVALLRICNL